MKLQMQPSLVIYLFILNFHFISISSSSHILTLQSLALKPLHKSVEPSKVIKLDQTRLSALWNKPTGLEKKQLSKSHAPLKVRLQPRVKLASEIKEFVSERKRMEFEPCGGGISRGPPPLSFKDTSEITRMLNEIESKHDVKILLAVGSGIKEWSLESTNIDIQFVFYRPLNLSKYLPNLPNASVSASDIIALASSAKRSNERGGSRKRFTGYNINELMKLVGEMYPPVVEMFYSATLHRLDERFATCVQLIRDVLEDTDQITKLVKNHGKVAESMIKFYKGARNDGQLSLDQLTQVARAIVAFEWQLLMYYAPYSIDEKTLACMRLVELNFENMLNDLRTHDSKISFNRIIPNDEIYDALKALVKKRLTSLSNDKVDDDLKWMDDLVVNTSKKIARMQLADSETSSRIANMVETVYNSMLDSLFNS